MIKILILIFLVSSGVFAQSIVGGTKVEKNSPEYKHTVRLYIKGILGKNDNFDGYEGIEVSWRCSASLLSSKLIITAAHCFPKYMTLNVPNSDEPEILPVDVSTAQVFFGLRAGEGSSSKVIRYYRHEGFDDNWYHKLPDLWNPKEKINDIAVGLLEYSAPYGKEPVSLINYPLFENDTLTLAGYGKSYEGLKPTLRKVSVPFREYLRNKSDFFVGLGDISSPFEVSDPQGACSGDSGGPAYSSDDKLAGIIVRGPDEGGGGCKSSVTILTGVLHYIDWINTQIRLLQSF